VNGTTIGEIGQGLLVLLGVGKGDSDPDGRWLAEKCVGLRIFPDDEGKMNRSLADIEGSMLVVSQFTLYGDCRKGRRPSFVSAASPEEGRRLYELFCEQVRRHGIDVATGEFQADMQVELVNNGPVTLWIESPVKSD